MIARAVPPELPLHRSGPQEAHRPAGSPGVGWTAGSGRGRARSQGAGPRRRCPHHAHENTVAPSMSKGPRERTGYSCSSWLQYRDRSMGGVGASVRLSNANPSDSTPHKGAPLEHSSAQQGSLPRRWSSLLGNLGVRTHRGWGLGLGLHRRLAGYRRGGRLGACWA
jgi:hypothetical protein